MDPGSRLDPLPRGGPDGRIAEGALLVDQGRGGESGDVAHPRWARLHEIITGTPLEIPGPSVPRARDAGWDRVIGALTR